jgi:glycine/D-amino acid oxidase-like deaminating enzyme
MTAYLLAGAGVQTTIIERWGVGSQASTFNSGTLGPLLGKGIPGALSGMAMAAFDLHSSLIDRLSPDYRLDSRVLCRLHLAASETELPNLQHVFDQYSRGTGFSASWLGANDLLELEPRLNRKFIRGVLTDGDLAVSGHVYTNALAATAQAAGASIIHDQVTGFKTSNGRVTAATCTNGEIHCGSVVIAAGPWSPEITRMLDYHISIKPVKGEMLRFVYPPSQFDISYNAISCYRRESDRTWAGCTKHDAGYDLSASVQARRQIVDAAVEIFPGVAGKTVDTHTAALRDVTDDGIPVFGDIPGWENAYVLAGGGFKGLLLSAIMAKSICDLITGSPLDSSISPTSRRGSTAVVV